MICGRFGNSAKRIYNCMLVQIANCVKKIDNKQKEIKGSSCAGWSVLMVEIAQSIAPSVNVVLSEYGRVSTNGLCTFWESQQSLDSYR